MARGDELELELEADEVIDKVLAEILKELARAVQHIPTRSIQTELVWSHRQISHRLQQFWPKERCARQTAPDRQYVLAASGSSAKRRRKMATGSLRTPPPSQLLTMKLDCDRVSPREARTLRLMNYSFCLVFSRFELGFHRNPGVGHTRQGGSCARATRQSRPAGDARA